MSPENTVLPAHIRREEVSLTPAALELLLEDYRPMECDPPPMDPDELTERLAGNWRPFQIQGVKR
jgi:hypothetical protein